jgi:hypothetical protein
MTQHTPWTLTALGSAAGWAVGGGSYRTSALSSLGSCSAHRTLLRPRPSCTPLRPAAWQHAHHQACLVPPHPNGWPSKIPSTLPVGQRNLEWLRQDRPDARFLYQQKPHVSVLPQTPGLECQSSSSAHHTWSVIDSGLGAGDAFSLSPSSSSLSEAPTLAALRRATSTHCHTCIGPRAAHVHTFQIV